MVRLVALNQILRLSRSEEHTSELQSPCNLVCRLLLEKKTGLPVVRRTLCTWSFPRPVPPRPLACLSAGPAFCFCARTCHFCFPQPRPQPRALPPAWVTLERLRRPLPSEWTCHAVPATWSTPALRPSLHPDLRRQRASG